METYNGNPDRNVLPPGISEEALGSAIDRSGFPLQIRVGERLRRFMHGVEEEWSYVDAESGDLRSLDICALRSLRRDEELKVVPFLSLLVECKQSTLPYVFFLLPRPGLRAIPEVAGLHADRLSVWIEDDGSESSVPIGSALSLERQDFNGSAAPVARNLTRAHFQGKDVTLSDSEAYNQLILPLTKAGDYFANSHTPRSGADWLRAHLVTRLAILDAPMVGVSLAGEERTLTYLPWVRVLRHIAVDDVEDVADIGRTVGIDVVHWDYLDTYLQGNLFPYAEWFAEVVVAHQDELESCRAPCPELSHADSFS